MAVTSSSQHKAVWRWKSIRREVGGHGQFQAGRAAGACPNLRNVEPVEVGWVARQIGAYLGMPLDQFNDGLQSILEKWHTEYFG